MKQNKRMIVNLQAHNGRCLPNEGKGWAQGEALAVWPLLMLILLPWVLERGITWERHYPQKMVL